jgi:hypothetical protein
LFTKGFGLPKEVPDSADRRRYTAPNEIEKELGCPPKMAGKLKKNYKKVGSNEIL